MQLLDTQLVPNTVGLLSPSKHLPGKRCPPRVVLPKGKKGTTSWVRCAVLCCAVMCRYYDEVMMRYEFDTLKAKHAGAA